jgi:hypothetical protein
MVKCQHESCGRENRLWLPMCSQLSYDKRVIINKSDTALHNWCVKCGCIQNLSEDHSKKLGYWINILSGIAKGKYLTQIQKRLIIKELESYEYFEDLYGVTGSAQKEIFIKTVKKYCTIHESIINSYVY